MSLIVKDSGAGDYTPCPEGVCQAVCADVQDLGEMENSFTGKMVRKLRIVWQTEHKHEKYGRPHEVSMSYTQSLHEKAGLRKLLEAWRGRKFTAAELAGFDVETLIGANCQIQVMHRIGQDGRTWANVASIMPIGKGMTKMAVSDGYVRRKDREGVKEMPAGAAVSPPADEEEIPF